MSKNNLAEKNIVIRGASVHNLKNIDLDIPRNKLVVITGLSGSGKSSLAFDTIFAEGQRRYVETLSPYARQFLGLMERPNVEFIDGLSPAISIEQKSISHNPRSTVGTVTEIYDFLRLLFARVGVQYCTNCNLKVEKQTIDQIVNSILKYSDNSKIQILSPIINGKKGHYKELFVKILKDGFLRVRVDGKILEITKGLKLDRYKIHNIEIVIDRIVVKKENQNRISEGVKLATQYGEGVCILFDGEKDNLFSTKYSCSKCGISYSEPIPRSFSFNSPYGACSECEGLGEKKIIDKDLIIPNDNISINDGALSPFGKVRDTIYFSQFKTILEKHGYDFTTPINKLSKMAYEELLFGTGKEKISVTYLSSKGRSKTYRHRFDGIIGIMKNYYANSSSGKIREWVEGYMQTSLCKECDGKRLKKENLSIFIQSNNQKYRISDIVNQSLISAKNIINNLNFSSREQKIAQPIISEIIQRLGFLLNVGLEYLSLNRSARTLSGGESQRIRLATQIGSQLVGVMYILDEPSIGLHQRDNLKLIAALKKLRDLDNTVLVVEHDKEMMENADYIVDLGPGAGEHGGIVVATGTPKYFHTHWHKIKSQHSSTVEYLIGTKNILIQKNQRETNNQLLSLSGATGNNLKNTNLKLPLGKFICITGVSGSGKSTLINQTLVPILFKKIYNSKTTPLKYKSISGVEYFDKIIEIDQSPIGRTPRSNPATYTGLFTFIRNIFSELPESKLRGYSIGRFSFNVKGGRCDTCEGDGVRKIEMNFLPDVYVACETCRGKRYNRETLEIHFREKSISDILEMTVEEALKYFAEHHHIHRILKTLFDVGLGYIRLGQQATTLSGGEAQRVKLATELARPSTGKTLFVLDEPTTGLHFDDIKMLLEVLNKIVDKGNTVVVIEHNLDVIKNADWIIDLGPEGGDKGGEIIAEGTPEEISKNKNSYTGHYLKKEFQKK